MFLENICEIDVQLPAKISQISCYREFLNLGCLYVLYRGLTLISIKKSSDETNLFKF